jgi:hypothetical protein
MTTLDTHQETEREVTRTNPIKNMDPMTGHEKDTKKSKSDEKRERESKVKPNV